jgi:rhamnogalacturonan acetylesterase
MKSLFRLAATISLASGLVRAQAPLPTLYLIGDSTVQNGRGDGSNGQWG